MTLKNNWPDASPISKFILLGLLMVFCSLICMGIFFTINHFLWQYDLNEISQLNKNTAPNIILVAKFLQISSQLGLFVLPALFFAYLTSNTPLKELKLNNSPTTSSIVLVIFITLLAIPFINILAIWNAELHLPHFMESVEIWMRDMQFKNDLLTEIILQMNSSNDILINVLMMVMLPAIGEELIFRGIIQKQLLKWINNPHWAIFITATIFSAFHLQFLGFFSRLLLGIIFGYFFYYSKNIWTAVTAHFINNGLALSLVLFYGTNNDPITNQSPSTSIIIASSIAFITASYLLFNKYSQLTIKSAKE